MTGASIVRVALADAGVLAIGIVAVVVVMSDAAGGAHAAAYTAVSLALEQFCELRSHVQSAGAPAHERQLP
jgi:hypothetical protein